MTNLPDNQPETNSWPLANYGQPEVIEADWWQPQTGSELAEQPIKGNLYGRPTASLQRQSGVDLGQPFSNLPAGTQVYIDNRVFNYTANSHNSVADSHNTLANYKLTQTSYRRTTYKRKVYSRKPSQLVWPLVFWAWFISVGLTVVNQLTQPTYDHTPIHRGVR